MRPAPSWLKPAVDYGPLAVFLATYYLAGLMPATAALMAATVVALAASWWGERRVPVMPVVTAAVVLVFGGLTVWLNDETFIKLKPTIIYGLFAATLAIGLALDKPLLKAALGGALRMDPAGWRALSLRLALFFAAMALANEVVRRVASTDVWVLWKVPGSIVATLLFMLAQMSLVQRHRVGEPPAGD
ncbi:septation protein A [Magnetospirillum sp. UT-4]|uniref:septation protein A n=1 Tax=Magnetospirillum sp. UT-4 TaxID=2681467 RepID=UPI001382F3DF|nr:septation protein A [Magnetospirillum sp. UT-4]CAA7620281.1 putative intracellular septation protein A [Magnetospirillum sp. UT-4]